MSRAIKTSDDPDIRSSEAALLRAARRALELGKHTQTPVWVLRDGRLVDLTGEGELVEQLPGDTEGEVPFGP